jgi:hypothetical protein
MNVETVAEAALFPEKEYISGIFVAVQTRAHLQYLMLKLRGLQPSRGIHLMQLLHLLKIPQLRQAETILHLLIGLVLRRICNQIQYGAK